MTVPPGSPPPPPEGQAAPPTAPPPVAGGTGQFVSLRLQEVDGRLRVTAHVCTMGEQVRAIDFEIPAGAAWNRDRPEPHISRVTFHQPAATPEGLPMPTGPADQVLELLDDDLVLVRRGDVDRAIGDRDLRAARTPEPAGPVDQAYRARLEAALWSPAR